MGTTINVSIDNAQPTDIVTAIRYIGCGVWYEVTRRAFSEMLNRIGVAELRVIREQVRS